MESRPLLFYRLFRAALDESELNMVHLMLGVEDGKPKNVREVAKAIGKTRERTRLRWQQIEKKVKFLDSLFHQVVGDFLVYPLTRGEAEEVLKHQ